jgi:hypothetical protein
MQPLPILDWIPYQLDISNGEIFCHWLNTFKQPYTKPFFEETVSQLKILNHRPGRLSSVSSLAALEEWAKDLDCVKPTAFIFHISRCGSTLASQLLGINEQHISISEAPFLDDLLRLPFKRGDVDKATAQKLFSAAVKFYAQKRRGDECNLFIKADSWHIFFYQQIRVLYPDVPFVFLYRSPDEVFNSHVKRRGMQAVPGLIEPELFGFDRKETLNTNQDHYTIKVLEKYLEAYIEIPGKDELSLFLDYREGIIPMINKIAAFTKIEISDDEMAMMESRAQYHSKYPEQIFAEKAARNTGPRFDRAFELYEILGKKIQAR